MMMIQSERASARRLSVSPIFGALLTLRIAKSLKTRSSTVDRLEQALLKDLASCAGDMTLTMPAAAAAARQGHVACARNLVLQKRLLEAINRTRARF